MKADPIKIQIPKTDSKIFAYTRWDIVPTIAAVFHLALFLSLYFLFPHAPLWVMLILGLVYANCINANINGISHNFIHNPYFRSPLLNRLFSLMESIACCFSQTYYDVVHMQHHKGNSDKQDETGETVDWISIYRHGHDGEAENVWSYVFLSLLPRQSGGDQPRDAQTRRDRGTVGQLRTRGVHDHPGRDGAV